MQHHIYISKENDPHKNLAMEKVLFDNIKEGESIFYLWQNAPVVVIGKHQNPYKEIDLEVLKKHNILLARRPTGGGAVYHDLGNTNFTFITYSSHRTNLSHFKETNNQIILNAMHLLGIEAVASGRNDIEVDGKKFSGSAFKEEKGHLLHHGTLLTHVDLARLQEVLTPAPLKIESKGIDSVRSRVINLVECLPTLDYSLLSETLLQAYSDYYSCEKNVSDFSFVDSKKAQDLEETIALYKDEKWQYGKTPEFTTELQMKVSFGLLDMKINVEKGLINEVTIYSDALDVDFIELLCEILKSTLFTATKIEETLMKAVTVYPQWQDQLIEFKECFLSGLKI